VLLYLAFLGIVTLLVLPVGEYLARVFSGRRTWPDRVLVPTERLIYRLAGIDVHQDMTWSEYLLAFVRFSVAVAVVIFAILLLQPHLPWFDPEHMTTPMTPDLALNTAISFSTTTTWQAYGGETTLGYLSQMGAITMGSFLAGAAGLAVGIAFIRGFARTRTDGLGNFWIDVTRAMLWVLLPVSLVGSLFLVWQGVPANLDPYTTVTTLEGGQQTIAQGPVAVLEFIKNLGTNGGGFFNVNGAHPYANPTSLTNVIGMLAIVVLPAALTRTFGRMTGRLREGWLLYGVMIVLFVVGLALTAAFEHGGNTAVASVAGIETAAGTDQPGGNMEGKEVRFGIAGSVLTANVTSNGATGSFNSMHDSYTPLGNAVSLTNMVLGELTFGGLGTGLYSLVMMVLVTVFLGGLMVGRVPEYLGKKLGPVETRPVVLYMLVGPATILGLTALAVVSEAGTAGLTANTGAHGFTQILFAYASVNANNGLTMASLNANSPFWNVTTAIAMLAGRFALPALALYVAGMFARQSRRAPTIAVLPTASWDVRRPAPERHPYRRRPELLRRLVAGADRRVAHRKALASPRSPAASRSAPPAERAGGLLALWA
jgi:K+-transporting ATPase ATPase A chain